MTFEKFTIKGLKADIFNYAIVKTHLTFKELSYFSAYDQDFQRKIDREHCDEIEEFITTNQYKYFPDIIMSIRHKDINMSSKIIINNSDLKINQLSNNDLISVSFLTSEIFKNIRIIDGNHRLLAIKSILEKNEYSHLLGSKTGVTFLIMHDDDNTFIREMALFYYLNTKAKPLIPRDLLSDFLDNRLDQETKNIDWWLFVFKQSYESLKDIFEHKIKDKSDIKEVVANACHYFSFKINKNDHETLSNVLSAIRELVSERISDYWINFFIENNTLDDYLSIIFFIYLKFRDIDKCAWEIDNFVFWMIKEAKLTNFENFENLYQTYKETYIPKDFKIFIAMEFANNLDVYMAIVNAIKKVGSNLGLELLPERIDKHITGTTYQIIDEIFNKISHNGLLIADITNKNPNVYLEVGYAMGIAKAKGVGGQVLLFVKNDGDKTNVGFDLQSYKQNRYSDTSDLQKQLENELTIYYNKPIFKR